MDTSDNIDDLTEDGESTGGFWLIDFDSDKENLEVIHGHNEDEVRKGKESKQDQQEPSPSSLPISTPPVKEKLEDSEPVGVLLKFEEEDDDSVRDEPDDADFQGNLDLYDKELADDQEKRSAQYGSTKCSFFVHDEDYGIGAVKHEEEKPSGTSAISSQPGLDMVGKTKKLWPDEILGDEEQKLGLREAIGLVKNHGILREGEDIYTCKSNPRGFCLIINNVDFVIFDARTSAEEDGVFLSSVFKQLGFELNYFKNLGAQDIEDIFIKYSKMETLKDHDALVCIIMSHGVKRDLIVGSDGLYVSIETLLAHFNNFNCPFLMNKPKLFFIQACRGDEYDYGTIEPTTTADAGPVPGPVVFKHKIQTDRIPTWSDMCIVHSTLQGYVALRSVQSGSWFAEALGWALIDHAHEKNLHEILMVVSSKLSKREGKQSIKQAIEVIWRGWNKNFYFNPGIYE